MTALGEHAVVLGASMAGLLAARVLADHFETVTVVERDTLHDIAETRRGVPQGRHLHGLLMRGAQALEELFQRSWTSLSPTARHTSTAVICRSSTSA
jgi:2-polyprenyl-6-methoxyphenol hydroxylase-like FAD-dependent oxidoreductase